VVLGQVAGEQVVAEVAPGPVPHRVHVIAALGVVDLDEQRRGRDPDVEAVRRLLGGREGEMQGLGGGRDLRAPGGGDVGRP